MRTKVILLLIFSAIATAFTSSEQTDKIVTVQEFKNYIDTIGLTFTMPVDYKEVLVKENRDLAYDFAIKNKKADFEIRYTVWPLKPQIEEYKACRKDPGCTMVHPNAVYKGRIQANVLNMTGGQNSDIGAFPPQAVKTEFNADAGGSSFFELNCGFGQGYKYAQMVYLHKENVADVIITYMSNDKEVHSALMNKPFHALTFK